MYVSKANWTIETFMCVRRFSCTVYEDRVYVTGHLCNDIFAVHVCVTFL